MLQAEDVRMAITRSVWKRHARGSRIPIGAGDGRRQGNERRGVVHDNVVNPVSKVVRIVWRLPAAKPPDGMLRLAHSGLHNVRVKPAGKSNKSRGYLVRARITIKSSHESEQVSDLIGGNDILDRIVE